MDMEFTCFAIRDESDLVGEGGGHGISYAAFISTQGRDAMKKHFKLLIVIIFLIGLPMAACGVDESGALTATISESEGGVEAKQPDDADFSTAEIGLVIQEMGQVKTMDDGRARLDLPNDTVIRVTPKSLFTLESVGKSTSRFHLDMGTLWIILKGGSLEVDTASGLAVVRGSYMSVSVDPDSGEVYIICLEGECEVSNDTGRVTLKTGETATIKNASTAPIKGIVTEDDVHVWLAENPEAIVVIPELGVPAIGDWVWLDAHPDGLQEDHETGVPGVTVKLYQSDGTGVALTRTNKDGLFAFTHVYPGDYYLYFIPPAGYRFTNQDAGSDDEIDSDADESGHTDVFTVGSGADLSIDAGLRAPEGTQPDGTSPPTHSPGTPPPTEEGKLPKPEVVEKEFVLDDGEVVKTRWHHRCPGKNVLVYLPWVGGDMNDWENYLSKLFPPDYPMSVLAISYPGCEGGCDNYEPDLWIRGLKTVMRNLKDYPCIDDEPAVIFMGASIGADYALMLCQLFLDTCSGAISLSPAGYVGQDLIAEALILMEFGVPVLYMYGEKDIEVASDPGWQLIERDADSAPWIFLYKLETGEHGIFLLNYKTIVHVIDFLGWVFYGIS
jgi:pimeloyl-ACP methyl ester carboxylesterase